MGTHCSNSIIFIAALFSLTCSYCSMFILVQGTDMGFLQVANTYPVLTNESSGGITLDKYPKRVWEEPTRMDTLT